MILLTPEDTQNTAYRDAGSLYRYTMLTLIWRPFILYDVDLCRVNHVEHQWNMSRSLKKGGLWSKSRSPKIKTYLFQDGNSFGNLVS